MTADVPFICQPGRTGQVHQLSYQHPISTGTYAAAREMVERGTCRCGLAVARFAFAGQAPINSRVRFFPEEQLTAVVAGLAQDALGPRTLSEWLIGPLTPGEYQWYRLER